MVERRKPLVEMPYTREIPELTDFIYCSPQESWTSRDGRFGQSVYYAASLSFLMFPNWAQPAPGRVGSQPTMQLGGSPSRRKFLRLLQYRLRRLFLAIRWVLVFLQDRFHHQPQLGPRRLTTYQSTELLARSFSVNFRAISEGPGTSSGKNGAKMPPRCCGFCSPQKPAALLRLRQIATLNASQPAFQFSRRTTFAGSPRWSRTHRSLLLGRGADPTINLRSLSSAHASHFFLLGGGGGGGGALGGTYPSVVLPGFGSGLGGLGFDRDIGVSHFFGGGAGVDGVVCISAGDRSGWYVRRLILSRRRFGNGIVHRLSRFLYGRRRGRRG